MFELYDNYNGYCIHKKVGYGSKYDGEYINIDICSDCIEKMIDGCAISPIVREVEKDVYMCGGDVFEGATEE